MDSLPKELYDTILYHLPADAWQVINLSSKKTADDAYQINKEYTELTKGSPEENYAMAINRNLERWIKYLPCVKSGVKTLVAAAINRTDLMEKHSLGVDTLRKACQIAGELGNIDFIRTLIARYPDYSLGHAALIGIAMGNHQHLVDYALSTGGNVDTGLSIAASHNNIPMVKMFVDRGATNWTNALWQMKNTRRKTDGRLLEYIMKTNPEKPWDMYMEFAVLANRQDIIDECLINGATSWSDCMLAAVFMQNLEMVKFFVGQGPTDLTSGLLEAESTGNQHIVEYFKLIGAYRPSGCCNFSKCGRKQLNIRGYVIEYLDI